MIKKSSLIIFLLFNFINIFHQHSAQLYVYKEPIRGYAIQNYNYTIQYKIHNVGVQPAFQVVFNDQISFPSNLFNLTKGYLKTELADIAPNEILIYSITVIPLIHGFFNNTFANVTYLSNKSTNETVTVHSSSDAEKYYIYSSLDECIARQRMAGIHYFLMTSASIFIPFVLYKHSRSKQKLSEEKCHCKRLIFDLQKILDDENLLEAFFQKSIQRVTAEDCKKVMGFRYKENSLVFLMNRLIYRQISIQLEKYHWFGAELNLFTKNKSFLTFDRCHPFNFDVRHQNNYMVFASSCVKQIGVSVLKVDKYQNYMDEISLTSKHVLEKLCKMHNQSLYLHICRFVCLKRAFTNACRPRIPYTLQIYEYDGYSPGCFITSTTVHLNGKILFEWLFEESFIGSDYVVAVCRLKNFYNTNCKFYRNSLPHFFSNSELNDNNEILKNATKLHPLQNDAVNEYKIFKNKLCKP